MYLSEFANAVCEAAMNNGVECYSVIVEPGYFTALFCDSKQTGYDATYYACDACNDDVKVELNQVALSASML